MGNKAYVIEEVLYSSNATESKLIEVYLDKTLAEQRADELLESRKDLNRGNWSYGYCLHDVDLKG